MKKSLVLALAVSAAAAHPALAVNNLTLNFAGNGTAVADTGFESAYNPVPDPNPGFDRTGFSVGPIINFPSQNALNIWTAAGDTFGRYEADPDDAQNVFFTNFEAGNRTTVTALIKYQNLNNPFHGGGVWVGTDEDHYVRLGVIFNPNGTNANKANVEMLRENEDLWGPNASNGQGHAGDGNDIAGQQVVIPNTPLIGTAPDQFVDAIDVTLQLTLTGHTVRTRYSLDGGANWTPVDAAVPYFAGVATGPADGATVEGGFKVGAYGFGGGANNALVSFRNYTASTVALPNLRWTSAADGSGSAAANWSEDVTSAATAAEGRIVELPAVGTGRRTITADTADLAAGTLIFKSPAGYTLTGPRNVVINDGDIDVQAGANEISTGLTMGGAARISGKIHVAAGASLKLSGDTVPRLSGVTVDAGGKLDLTHNSLQIDYFTPASDPYASIVAQLKSGFHGGKWDGLGIVSSDAANDPTGGTTLGVLDTGVTPWPRLQKFGPHNVGSGNPASVSPGSSLRDVLVMYTWYGDTNLDGKVDAADRANIVLTSAGGTWATGDFNYDGVVNADDFMLFNLGAAVQNRVLAAVPEPASGLSAAGLFLAALARRRRRSSRDQGVDSQPV